MLITRDGNESSQKTLLKQPLSSISFFHIFTLPQFTMSRSPFPFPLSCYLFSLQVSGTACKRVEEQVIFSSPIWSGKWMNCMDPLIWDFFSNRYMYCFQFAVLSPQMQRANYMHWFMPFYMVDLSNRGLVPGTNPLPIPSDNYTWDAFWKSHSPLTFHPFRIIPLGKIQTLGSIWSSFWMSEVNCLCLMIYPDSAPVLANQALYFFLTNLPHFTCILTIGFFSSFLTWALGKMAYSEPTFL